MFGYDFVSLTPEQIEWRRQELDRAGYQAYLAPILLLSLIYVLRQLKSPASHNSKSRNASVITLYRRRISWLLNTTVISEFGPVQVQLLGLAYATFLIWRIVYNTGDDYMHVTKALGHVAVSQLPLHYLLSIKWPSSPITWITGLTHERLNAYHRLFGRIVHILLATHAILYLIFFVKINALQKRIKDSDVQLGIAAFWSLNFLGIFAIPPIRQKLYHRVFYRSHVILSAILLVVLWFHVKYTRIYVAQAGIFWVGNGILRTWASQDARIEVEQVGSSLLRVTATLKGGHLYPYIPGCHVYLNGAGLGPRTPFTVVSAKAMEAGKMEVTLVAKNSSGPMTGSLAQAASEGQILDLQIEGPYGEAQIYMPALLEAAKAGRSRFLLVAGGVGATYALPIYKALCDANNNGKDEDNVRLLWVARRAEDVLWAAGFFEENRDKPGLYLSLTQAGQKTEDVKGDLYTRPGTGRPDIHHFIEGFFANRPQVGIQANHSNTVEMSSQKDRPTYVLVCGPAALSASVHKTVGKYVLNDGGDVRWYEEQFGFGG